MKSISKASTKHRTDRSRHFKTCLTEIGQARIAGDKLADHLRKRALKKSDKAHKKISAVEDKHMNITALLLLKGA